MSKGSLVKVIIIGNAGSDAELRFMPSGAAVANVNIATSESWRDKQTGQMQERTEWHRVVFMDIGNYRLGQIAGDHIKKGSKVYVEGTLRTRSWEKDGITRYTTEVIVSEFQFLDSRHSEDQDDVGNHQRSGQGTPNMPSNNQTNNNNGYNQANNGFNQANIGFNQNIT
ncbi:single-stranded DNA-binding protein [Marinomonas sp. TI.3.20]|uniref:single-stranded DNA-binding protein n=1 Tax=Marinomonas sp. TI.3.20 TaxID=3121296 RepID=UPI0031205582